ncbi:hypothetical protein [Enterococcus timonensis]|uniref:hypothetical protein n=1 Tax=Enterococcus timonensis TaxID=1852364 RepID=UPI00131A0809|nr:hypothetical protein [Enterococcus timonensis]
MNTESLTKLSIIKNGSTINLQKGSSWEVEQVADSVADYFVEKLGKVRGKKVSEVKDYQSLYSVRTPEIEGQILKKDTSYFFKKGRQFYELANVAPILANYDEILFTGQPIQSVMMEGLSQMTFEQGTDEEFTLAKESKLSKIESAPFIGGWFLVNHYTQDFSVAYDQGEELLINVTNFRGKVITDSLPEENLQQQFSMNEQIFKLYQVDGKYYLKDALNRVWQLPDYQGKLLEMHPFNLIDRFLALIMADALDKLTIQTEDQTWKISSTHTLNADQTKIQSEFFVGDQKINEESFRKVYQYIGVLSADFEYQGETYQKDPQYSLTYDFTSEGQSQQRNLKFFPLTDDEDRLAVEKDGVIDFICNQSQVAEMIKQIQTLVKK